MARLIEWTIKDIVECVEGLLKNKFDVIAIFEGTTGIGKSTLAYKILKRVKCKNKFNPYKDLAYSREDVLKAVASRKNSCILADELINVAHNRDFYDEMQKQLVKAFNMYRDSCNVFAGCVPKFSTIDNQLQQLCRIRFTIIERGVALIHLPKPSIFSPDKWDIKRNMKIEQKWAVKEGKARWSELTTVKGIVFFGPLTKKQELLYHDIKQRRRGRVFKKYEEQDKVFDPKEQFENKLYKMVVQKRITPDELKKICSLNGYKYDNINRKINHYLKDHDYEGTFRDYVKPDNINKNKKDGMGFTK